jgi:hypothetical protein
MFRMKTHSYFLYAPCTLLALVLVLSACNVPANAPVAVPTDPVPSDPPTQAPVEESAQDSNSVTVNVEGVAGYPITSHLLKAQIFVYPVAGLGVNETTGGVAGSLQTLLQSQQVGDRMPYLPLYNAAQVMHTQVAYLDFKNGRGVRYLTQFDQAPLPINNYELHYTFQGLTSDGKYYVAAVLPVNLAGLPSDASVDLDNPPANFVEDFPRYLSDTVDMLSGQPASAFIPDLSGLDAMMSSLEIK